MFSDKHLASIFILLIALLFPSLSYSQTEDSLSINNDTTTTLFKKVLLDGRISYLNEKTKEIVSQSEYINLSTTPIEKIFQDKNYIGEDDSTSFWQNDRVNPYVNVVLPTPYKIKF